MKTVQASEITEVVKKLAIDAARDLEPDILYYGGLPDYEHALDLIEEAARSLIDGLSGAR